MPHFCDPYKNNWSPSTDSHLYCCPVLPRARLVLDHSERLPNYKLRALSTTLLTKRERPWSSSTPFTTAKMSEKGCWCGTCYMAWFFSPVPGTTTANICSSSNLLVATFMQHLVSHPTSGSLLTTSSPLPSPLTVTSHLRSEGTNASSSSSHLYSWCIPHNLLSVTKSPVWRLSSRILQAISYSSDLPKALKIFYCRNGVLVTNNISMASAPHQRC